VDPEPVNTDNKERKLLNHLYIKVDVLTFKEGMFVTTLRTPTSSAVDPYCILDVVCNTVCAFKLVSKKSEVCFSLEQHGIQTIFGSRSSG
jgi:hypothetical protein